MNSLENIGISRRAIDLRFPQEHSGHQPIEQRLTESRRERRKAGSPEGRRATSSPARRMVKWWKVPWDRPPQRPDPGSSDPWKGRAVSRGRGPEECGRLRSNRLLGVSPRLGSGDAPQRIVKVVSPRGGSSMTSMLSTRAQDGPFRHHCTSASTSCAGPSKAASTSPRSVLRTHPPRPAPAARRRHDARYPTPCTCPWTSTRRRVVFAPGSLGVTARRRPDCRPRCPSDRGRPRRPCTVRTRAPRCCGRS